MAVFVDETTKVVYQGLTGSQGRFYGLLNREYGTQVVAGTNPRKAGSDVDGIPVYASVPTPWGHRRDSQLHLHPRPWRAGRRGRGRRGRCHVHRLHHRGRAGARRGLVLQQAPARLPQRPAAGPQLSRHHQPRQGQHRHHRRAHRQGSGARRDGGRHRQPLRHAHLPGALRAEAQRHRGVDVRGDRGRSGAGHVVHRLPRGVRGRPRHPCGDDDRRDRWLGRGRGRRVHRVEDDQAGGGLHRRRDRAPGKKMGHAGAIVSGGKGTAQAKMDALRDAGARVGLNPTEAGQLMVEVVRDWGDAVRRACGRRRSSPRPAVPARCRCCNRPRSDRTRGGCSLHVWGLAPDLRRGPHGAVEQRIPEGVGRRHPVGEGEVGHGDVHQSGVVQQPRNAASSA